jgi:hypothetical protein
MTQESLGQEEKRSPTKKSATPLEEKETVKEELTLTETDKDQDKSSP